MAKYDDKNKKIPIRYSSRDFNSIKTDLVNYAKRYYPNTFKDFNEASFGSLMLDTVSYVGDVMSFYLDYQVNESFLDTANEYENVVKLTRQMGYKYRGRPAAHGFVSFYVLVPSNATGLAVDSSYVPILKRGSQVISDSGESYLTTQDVDFRNSANEIVVGRVDATTGLPTHYIIKAIARVVSGQLAQEKITVGAFKRFNRIKLDASNVAEVLECTDTEGHDFFEVEHLGQDVIYRSIDNSDSATSDTVPSILKPISAPRRFVVERDGQDTFMQFGYGSEEEVKIDKVVDPSNVVLEQYAKDYVTNTDFDPSNLLGTDKFGVAPVNTTLRVIYRKNVSDNPNAGTGKVNTVGAANFSFENPTILNQATINQVRSSLECSNDDPIIGNVSLPSTEELKIRTKAFFATQNRAVTREDYKALVYSMPPKFGSVKRCAIMQDRDSFKRNLNMYIISEDANGLLTPSNVVLKENLKTWLNQYRMVNDTLDIMDAKVINLALSFTIVTKGGFDKFKVLNKCLLTLQDRLSRHYDISEPFSYTEIYSTLNRVEGVSDTTDVNLTTVVGGAYSTTSFDIDKSTTPDGRFVACPLNCIFEFKFPTIDIKGGVK
tara:strand:- start:5784 stop:7595 length:1812 start_codon:yes stop_codon:yes gene_type:complete